MREKVTIDRKISATRYMGTNLLGSTRSVTTDIQLESGDTVLLINGIVVSKVEENKPLVYRV